jgi:hypothetical protein
MAATRTASGLIVCPLHDEIRGPIGSAVMRLELATANAMCFCITLSKRRFKNGGILSDGAIAHADARDHLALASMQCSPAHGTMPPRRSKRQPPSAPLQ